MTSQPSGFLFVATAGSGSATTILSMFTAAPGKLRSNTLLKCCLPEWNVNGITGFDRFVVQRLCPQAANFGRL
ncbi:hypothetical protein [Phormidesmis sp. 146-12]